MTFKKIMSMLLALSMVMGLMVTGVFADGTEATVDYHEIKSADELNIVGTGGRDDTGAPSGATMYYLTASNGTDTYFYKYGTATGSDPYSLPVTTNVAEATNVWLTNNLHSNGELAQGGFQITHGRSGTNMSLYMWDYVATGGTASAKDTIDLCPHRKWEGHQINFALDSNGWIYQNETLSTGGDPVKYVIALATINDRNGNPVTRFVAVPASEVDNETIFPVYLTSTAAEPHTYKYKNNTDKHWQECSCGAKKDEAAHSHEWMVEGDSHWQECVCGDKIVADTHTPATEWSKDADNHWHVCSCGYITDKSAHTYGDYVQDYVNGQQTKTCSGCGDQVTVSLSHDCTADETKWYVDGEYHYRKCSLCGEAMESTKAKHTYPETFEKDETQHWQVCTVCDELSTKADHDHKTQKNDDQHWTACACGDETTKENHNYTNWTVTTPATETTAGSRTGKCACGAEKTVPIPPVLKEGVYYLTGKVGGEDRYFVHGTITNTSPYSQNSTTDKTAATTVNISYNEETLTYTLTYETNKTLYLYINDENPKGDVDTGVTGSEREDRTPFLWDAENKVLYQMEGDVKYVLAFKTMTNKTSEKEEVRIAAVPYSELSSTVVAIQLEIYHEHSFGESWKSDASSHWHECACGAKSGEAEHTVTNWTVEKEATETEAGKKVGACDTCGYELISIIPATGAVNAPRPEDGDVNRLSVVINGVRYYYRHTETGESVTSTTPYSLYVTTDASKAIDITVKADGDGYILCYDRGDKNLRVYLNGNGVGITASEDPAMVRFYWDAQNKALYQMEGDVKYYLVFKTLNNELRITAVPETEALAGADVYLMKLYGDTSANTGDGSMIGLMALLMVLSVCAMAGVVTARKKLF